MNLISVVGLSFCSIRTQRNLHSHKNSIKGLEVVNLLPEKDFIEYVYFSTWFTRVTRPYR